ncbi:MAG: indole-3-glycerol phosphate synthase TrpC [Bacteroidia bacterium]
MNILDKIISAKKKAVTEQKELFPVKLLERSVYFQSQPVSFKEYLCRGDKSGIIAEFKRRSPSKGVINQYADVERTSIGYMQAGASALSILTDQEFFGGKNDDLTVARKFNYCPILRKDFIIDEYQVIEAKSIGADAILLLAGVLSPAKIREFATLAHSLGLEVLLEIREEKDLAAINEFVDAVGVNNRDLKTFDVDVKRSFELAGLIPENFVRISESGLDSAATVEELREAGYRGFLMGEKFMRNSRPEQACAQFIRELKTIKSFQYDRV